MGLFLPPPTGLEREREREKETLLYLCLLYQLFWTDNRFHCGSAYRHLTEFVVTGRWLCTDMAGWNLLAISLTGPVDWIVDDATTPDDEKVKQTTLERSSARKWCIDLALSIEGVLSYNKKLRQVNAQQAVQFTFQISRMPFWLFFFNGSLGPRPVLIFLPIGTAIPSFSAHFQVCRTLQSGTIHLRK